MYCLCTIHISLCLSLSSYVFNCISRLEAEIEDARMKAKEEMMQGIQVAREMAQKELSDQKLQYENRIKVLEKELVR